ncbi:TadE/TadG family type IV pilus assembly protein [Lederbergia citri]|nr:TadE/TadG family type IV pilus assembly protein [Lederbergia citri]
MKAFMKKENGNVLILTAVALIALLAITGLVIDGGIMYMQKSHLQKTANAAALSGAQELTNQDERVRQVVSDILRSHGESDAMNQLEINSREKVKVQLSKPVKLAFSSLFGINTVEVKAEATASLGVMGRASGVSPLGVDETVPLELYREYKLKVGSGDSAAGNFGILALGGTGASTYEENLRYGYHEELKVGDVIATQTGNITEKTRSAVQEKINGCPESLDNLFKRDCSRIILVPVYRPYNISSNQVKAVIITGFAYFYIKDPMNSKDTSVTGMFIERAGTGYTEKGAKNYGTYVIRLSR